MRATSGDARKRWAQKTSARQFDAEGFRAYKTEHGLFLLGVMGFAGAWKRSGLPEDALARQIDDARRALQNELEAARARHQGRLVMVSGATNAGVLALAYDLCAALGVRAMGVTPTQALRYDLGAMDFLVPHGKRFGDESGVFVDLCDEFMVLGGGEQSRSEALAAAAQGKRVTLLRGFGGAADALTLAEVPGARLVERPLG